MRVFTHNTALGLLIIILSTSHAFSQDASLSWAAPIEGTSLKQSFGIASDGSGNVLSTGFFAGTVDFNPGVGVDNITATGIFDTYVSKLDAFGNHVWAKKLGGTNQERGQGIAVDASNNVFTVGYYAGTVDFDPDGGTANHTSNGGNDVFLSKLSSAGSYVWSISIGGTGSDLCRGVATDADGNIYITGSYQNTVDFDPSGSATNLVSTGGADAFVAKYSSTGALVWAKSLSSGSNVFGLAIKADQNTGVYITGTYQNTVDLDPGAGTSNHTSQGGSDIFAIKLDTAGNYQWGASLGGASADFGNSVSSDAAGNVYVTGEFQGTADFDPGAGTTNLVSQGSRDVFVCKLSPTGGLAWVKQVGGADDDRGVSIAMDTSANAYVTGSFAGSVDFDPSGSVFQLTSNGLTDVYMLKLDANGDLVWAKQIGGPDTDAGYGIDVNQAGFIHSTGGFQNTVDFDPGFGTFNLTATASTIDAYVHKMGPCSIGYDTLTAMACDSFTSPTGSEVWYSTGTYHDTLLATSGCDSIITVFLTVGNTSSEVINDVVCDSFSAPSGNYVWLTSGTYYDTIPNLSGCDSLMTFNLTVVNTTFSSISPVVCDSFTAPSGNHTWNTSGSYQDTLINGAGCDSVITINLTVNNTLYETVTSTICDSMVSPSGNYIWTTSGVYVDTLSTIAGCDSVITFNLTVNSSTTATISPTACDFYKSPSLLYTWTTSGVYYDTITNVLGCDSLLTINLTIIQSSASSINPVVCDSFTSPSGAYTWSSSGVYLDTIPNTIGCDSVITINLTVNQTTFSSITTTVCDSMVSPSANFTWTSSGIYNDTLINAAGCDSILTFNLTVNQTSTAFISVVACNSYTSPSSNYVWSTSGIYIDTITNFSGCDSIVTVDLTINNSSNGTLIVQACDSFSAPSGNHVWTTSGTYIDTLVNTVGCDSLLLVTLTIDSTQYVNLEMSACDSLVSPSGNHVWTASGIYIDSLLAISGCDSILTVDLTINSSEVTNINETACNSYLWTANGTTYNESGLYETMLSTSMGCDSLVALDLTVYVVDTSITRLGSTLMSNATGVSYRWLDCELGYIPISDQTNATFSPTKDYGEYAIEINNNGCIDTSACYVVKLLGLESNVTHKVSVYPNPTNGHLSVQLGSDISSAWVRVRTIEGRLVSQNRLSGTANHELNLNGAKGYYFLEFDFGHGKTEVIGVVKQ